MMNASSLAETVFAVLRQTPELLRPTTIPRRETLESLLEEVFWSSLDKYEGVPLRARLYVAPPDPWDDLDPWVFRLRQPCSANRENIRRFSPAHGDHGGLVVVEGPHGPEIVGLRASSETARITPTKWLRIESTGTGVVRVVTLTDVLLEFRRGKASVLGGLAFDDFAAIAMIAGCAGSTGARSLQVAEMFLSLARTIDRSGAGGAVWLLPANDPRENELRVHGIPITTSMMWNAPFREEWEMRTCKIRMLNPPVARPERMEEIQMIAQAWDLQRKDAVMGGLANLGRVDGAILASMAPDVVAFGVICNKFETPATRVMRVTDPSRPLEGGDSVDAAEFGGSRHQSAIDFCSSFAPAAAIVASHDGGMILFVSRQRGEVRGMRIAGISSTAQPAPSLSTPDDS